MLVERGEHPEITMVLLVLIRCFHLTHLPVVATGPILRVREVLAGLVVVIAIALAEWEALVILHQPPHRREIVAVVVKRVADFMVKAVEEVVGRLEQMLVLAV